MSDEQTPATVADPASTPVEPEAEGATVSPLVEVAPEEKRAVTNYVDAERLHNLGLLTDDELAELRARGLLPGGQP